MTNQDDRKDAAPTNRKKKKKKKQTTWGWPLLVGLSIGGLLALGLLVWLVVRFTAADPPALAVTAWEKYATEENEFGFDYPAGWKVKSYGIRNKREAEITSGQAAIIVKENLAGSAVGDIAKSLGGGKPVDDEHSPVAKVHELSYPKESSNYKEEPAVTVKTRFGKARRSTYTDGLKRGYRVTLLLHQTALHVFCECRVSDWETLRPAFEHVIESLGRGES